MPLAHRAAMAGKDMYVEKPLGVAMAWAWKLRAAAARKKVVFQYGTQQRSSGSSPGRSSSSATAISARSSMSTPGART
ncbi:MAG: hypothetical protein MZV64_64555 [Ignavibacteriales bacterium]|nr:hypothetical protein [Ignavibacteriales bacterium]